MAAKILLEVEDGKVVALAEGEELAESGISLDGLLVHQVVGLSVGHDTLGDRRAANLSSLSLAKEGAELISNLDGLGEDARLGLSTLDLGAGPLAATVSTLGKAGSLLLNGLESRSSGSSGRLEVVEVLLEGGNRLLKRSTEVLIDGSRGSRGNNSLDNSRDSRGSNGLSLGGLLGDLGGGSGHRGSYGSSLSLSGLLGGLGGRAHRTSGGGCRSGHLTQ